MVEAPLATAADYADAMIIARRAKNVLFVLIFLMLLGQMCLFFTLRYKFHLAPNAAQTFPLDLLKYAVGLIDFLGVAAPLILAVVLLLVVDIMLVGRLIGVSRLTAAFLWCIVLTVLLFPWQAFLINQTFSSPAFKWPGVLYTWTELLARADSQPPDHPVLFWGRFVGWPIIALVILLTLQFQSSRGLKLALGETPPAANTEPPAV